MEGETEGQGSNVTFHWGGENGDGGEEGSTVTSHKLEWGKQ